MLIRNKAWQTMRFLAGLVGVAGGVACEKATPTTSADPNSQAHPTVPVASAEVTNTNAVVETTHDPLAGVANRDRITPDPHATNIDPPKDAVLVTGAASIVREAPRGSSIEVLETTANVKEIQRDGDYYLVTYPDPKGSKKVFAGWVYRDALIGEGWSGAGTTVGTPAATGKLSCARGETHLRTTTDFCGKTCKDDRDCSSDKQEICDGLAFKVNERTNAASDARYCISDSSPSANAEHAREHGSSANLPVNK